MQRFVAENTFWLFSTGSFFNSYVGRVNRPHKGVVPPRREGAGVAGRSGDGIKGARVAHALHSFFPLDPYLPSTPSPLIQSVTSLFPSSDPPAGGYQPILLGNQYPLRLIAKSISLCLGLRFPKTYKHQALQRLHLFYSFPDH